jgi:hypothetical protein
VVDGRDAAFVVEFGHVGGARGEGRGARAK